RQPMGEAGSANADAARHAGPAVLVSSEFPGDAAEHLGTEAYSYHFVERAFRPLFERVGPVTEVDHPESRLDHAVRAARRAGCDPVHVAFAPLQRVYLGSLAPNVAFPFWEFPDLPRGDFDDNPRNDWVRIAERLDLVLCASEFTRQAFLRAGVG